MQIRKGSGLPSGRPSPWTRLSAVALLGIAALIDPAAAKDQQPLPARGGAGASAHPARSPFDADFAALVQQTLEAWHVPGVSIAVLDGDKTWLQGFGVAAWPDTPVTPDTLFYTASTTKAFVAASLSLIIDSHNYTELSGPGTHLGVTNPPGTTGPGGHTDAFQATAPALVDWSTPLANILRDDFVIADDPWATTHLAIEDALSHRTGLGGHDPTRSRRYGLDPESRGRNATVRDVTRSLRHLPLTHPPRTTYRYCNLMFLVLSHVVETLTGGRWLGDVLHAWIWAPLGMNTTFLSLDDARAAPPPAFLANGYYWHDGTTSFVQVPHMPLEEVSGAGGIVSTVRDYAQWVRCWLDGPAFSETGADDRAACGGIPFTKGGLGAILTPKTFITPSSASPAPFDAPAAYASGWTTNSYKGHRFWAHAGGSNAFGTEVFFFPDDRYGLVLFGNTASTSNIVETILLWHLASDRFGIPPEQRYDWDAHYRASEARRVAKLDDGLQRLYPDRAQPGLPPALPLAAYVGTYHHPAYQNLTVTLAAGPRGEITPHRYAVSFSAERPNQTWPTLCEFVHVSGEHWLVFTDMLYERSGHFKAYARARFVVGVDGRASALVVEYLDVADDVVEGVITFERVDV